MDLPVLAKDLSLALRRPKAFVVAGLAYGFSVLGVTLAWGLITSNPTISHVEIARAVFYTLIFASTLGLSFDEALVAAASLAGEREGGTEDLLRTAPRAAWIVVLEKWSAPFLLQALFLFGMLPFLSLLFFLGGISSAELAYQGLNLLVWLNTCIAIGIHSSARCRSVRHASARAATAIGCLGLIFPVYCLGIASLSASKAWALESFLWPSVAGFLQQVADLLSYLTPLSPVWLFDSWFAVLAGIPLVLLAIFLAHETFQTVHGARLEQDQRRRVVAVLGLWAILVLPVGNVYLVSNDEGGEEYAFSQDAWGITPESPSPPAHGHR